MVFTKSIVEEIIKLYESGVSAKEIATKYGTYNTSIRRVLLRNNIKLRDSSEALASVKTNPFAEWETKEVAAYWLGYLAADGCVSKLEGEVKGGFRVVINTNKDPEHLKKYAEYVNRPLGSVLNKTYNVYEYSVAFCNKSIVEWLHSVGITNNKSLTLELKVPINIHFLRGYFDGNGSVKKAHKTITFTTGSQKLAQQIQEYLNNTFGLASTIYTDKRGNVCYNLTLNKENSAKLHSLMYQDATIYIERKKAALL